MANDFFGLLGALGKGLPQTTQLLEQRKAEKKTEQRSAAQAQAARTQEEIKTLEARAEKLASANPAMAEALTARANQLRGTLALVETDPVGFLREVTAINTQGITMLSGGDAVATTGPREQKIPIQGVGVGAGEAADVALPRSANLGTAQTVSQTDVNAAVRQADLRTQRQTAAQDTTTKKATAIIAEPQRYTPEAVQAAQSWLNGATDDTAFLGAQPRAYTAEDVKTAMNTGNYRAAWAAAQSLGQSASGLSPEAFADLETRAGRADQAEQYGLDAQSISIRQGLLNLETGEWSLTQSMEAWDRAKAKDDRSRQNEQRSLLNEWINGGNIEALESLSEEDFREYGYTKETALARARTVRGQRDRATNATIDQAEIGVELARQQLEDAQRKGVNEQADLFNRWEEEGQVTALEGGRDAMRALGWTDEQIDDRIAAARVNRGLVNRAKEAGVTTAEAQSTIARLEADSRKRLQGVTDTKARADALKSVVDQGVLGIAALDALRADGTISQAEYNEAVLEATATQNSKDIERFARDTQNQALGEQAAEATRRIQIANGAADAADIQAIAKMGNAGVPILKRLLDQKLITQTQYDEAVRDARDYERDGVVARQERNLDSAERQIAVWAGQSTPVEQLMKSPQWAQTKVALGMNDAQLTAFIKQQRAAGVNERNYTEGQRKKKDAQEQLDAWAATGQDLSKVPPEKLQAVMTALGLSRDAVQGHINAKKDERADADRFRAAQLAGQNLNNQSTAQDIALSYQQFQVNMRVATQNLELNRAKAEAEIAALKAKTPGTAEYAKAQNQAVKNINAAAEGYRKTAAAKRAQAQKMLEGFPSPEQKQQAQALIDEAAQDEASARSLYDQAAQLSGAATGQPLQPGQPGKPATPGAGTPATPTAPTNPATPVGTTPPPRPAAPVSTDITFPAGVVKLTPVQYQGMQTEVRAILSRPNPVVELEKAVGSWLKALKLPDTPENRAALIAYMRTLK
jgi:hypothetical protein